ncbi:OmpA family protein [Nisaea nitritireducens]|uniref:OmpA family protein n=1 Tax=Nisaea nitritireducens TaxID=568392 RepID=UPI00186840E8|nr:OmpA family protein [Nisaea nitritireducens]
MPDALNPVEWYNDSASAVGGWFDDSDADTSGDTGAYPNVSSVPENSTPRTTATERAGIKDELVSDRANAQYDDKGSVPSVTDASTGSLAQIQPKTPVVSAPSEATESAAAEQIKPLRMTASDEATKQMEAPEKAAAPSLPSQAVADTENTSPRSSLWPNSPAPESAGDRPVTSARVGEPTTRESRTDQPRNGTLGPRYKKFAAEAKAGSSETVADESPSVPETVQEVVPAAEPATETASVPTAPEPATETASVPTAAEPVAVPEPEPTPAPLAVEPGPLALTVPESRPFNFDDPSVIVDESALPGAFESYPAGGGGSYQAGIIRFSNGSSHLSSSDRGVIRELVPLIREYNANVEIVGHASSRTRNMDPSEHKLINFEVSLKRANAVAQALINAGAPSDRISVVAVGDSQPVSSEAMPAGEADNRRAEIYLIY